jgi:putative acetyltransferase
VSPADGITIELVSHATDDVRILLSELDQILAAEYPPEQRHGLGLEAIFKPTIRFFLAWLNGAAVGSGGVTLFPDLPK